MHVLCMVSVVSVVWHHGQHLPGNNFDIKMRFEAQARFMHNLPPIKLCPNVVIQIICFNVVLSMRLQPHITHIHQRHHVHLKVDCPMHVCNHSADTKETMYSTCSGTNFDINHTSKLSLWCLLGGYPKSVCRLWPKQTADSTCQRCAKHACACNHTADTTVGQL